MLLTLVVLPQLGLLVGHYRDERLNQGEVEGGRTALVLTQGAVVDLTQYMSYVEGIEDERTREVGQDKAQPPWLVAGAKRDSSVIRIGSLWWKRHKLSFGSMTNRLRPRPKPPVGISPCAPWPGKWGVKGA